MYIGPQHNSSYENFNNWQKNILHKTLIDLKKIALSPLNIKLDLNKVKVSMVEVKLK